MPVTPTFEEQVLAARPKLKAFAMKLTGKVVDADDLVQETMSRAFRYKRNFQPGTNIDAWLFTIQRNFYYSAYKRRTNHEALYDPDVAMAILAPDDQNQNVLLHQILDAIGRLPVEQGEVILLIGNGEALEDSHLDKNFGPS